MADLAGAEQVLAAAACIRTGECFGLDYALDAFDPPMAADRGVPRHTITAKHDQARDDHLDAFFLQATSQIDGLRHRRAQGHGFYDGHPDEAVAAGSPTLGVQRWAQRPIVGRGVLLDVEGSRADAGRPLDHSRAEVLEVSDLEHCVRAQGVTMRPGDIALVHTGWARWYLALPGDERVAIRDQRLATGFAQRTDFPRWLWEQQLAAFATDTFAVERLPVIAGSDYADTAVDDAGMMHQELIGKLGMPLGELWNLHDLVLAARTDRRWDCLVVVKPLHLTGGVGSPANATAVR
jgi:kynurenine formamidase